MSPAIVSIVNVNILYTVFNCDNDIHCADINDSDTRTTEGTKQAERIAIVFIIRKTKFFIYLAPP